MKVSEVRKAVKRGHWLSVVRIFISIFWIVLIIYLSYHDTFNLMGWVLPKFGNLVRW